MKFYQFEIHEYMDMYPETIVHTFESVDDAKAYASHMNSSYSGGTTRFVKELDAMQAYRYIHKNINSLFKDYSKYANSPNSIHHVSDKDIITYVETALRALNECYPL